MPGNRNLDRSPFPACSSQKQPAGSAPGCGDVGMGVGFLAAEKCSVLLPPPCPLGAQCLLLLLFSGWGYPRTWRLCCIESSAVRQRDDKQPDGSSSVPVQEYLCCKHAGPAVTQARFTCLICRSWKRWICFPAPKWEWDESICLLRLNPIFSKSFCCLENR